MVETVEYFGQGLYKLVHSPDEPDLWIVYRSDIKVAQFENKQAAIDWIYDHGASYAGY